jgi:hypothetical protein
MEIVWSVGLIVMIVVALPCLLLRPLFLAIADRIAGRKSSAKEIQELKDRILALENSLRSVSHQVISLESSQEFSNKLLEDLKSGKKSE